MWPDAQLTEDLVTFTEEIANGIFHSCAVPGQYSYQTETRELIFNSNHLTVFCGNISGLTAVSS